MINIELPDMDWHDTVLELEQRVTKGSQTAHPPPGEQLADRMRIGGPVCVPITLKLAGDDHELLAMLMAEAHDYRYVFLHLACTFQPQEDETFDKAWIQIQLECADGVDMPIPIAWSMTPTKISQPITFSSGLSVGASLKFLHVDGSFQRELARDLIFLEALNEMRADPTWAFSRTRQADLRGSQRLVMVVRAPKAATVRGKLHLKATVQRRFLKVFPYRVSFPNDDEYLMFNLP